MASQDRAATDRIQDVAHDRAEEILYERGHGRARWGAIFVGTVYALGLMVLLGVFGVALGVSLFEPTEGTPMNGALTTTAIWQFISSLVALGVGGYAAGRLAGILPAMGAMFHGAAVWALTTLAAVWLATSTLFGVANVAGSAVSSLASGAGSAASAVIPDDFSLPDLSIPSVELSDLPEGVQETLRANGLTPDNFQAEAREAFRAVVSQQEQEALTQQATQTAGAIVASPGDIGQDAERFVEQVFGRGGILGPEDREEALAVMEDRFGLTPAQAEQYVDRIAAEAEQLQQEAAQAVAEAAQAAQEAADAAADATASAAWVVGLASLLGLIAAVGGAYVGRPART